MTMSVIGLTLCCRQFSLLTRLFTLIEYSHKEMKMKNMFKAVSWIAGHGVTWCANGNRNMAHIKIVAFPTKKERDEWVKQGNMYPSQPDYREPLRAKDALPYGWTRNDVEQYTTYYLQ